MKRYIFSSVFFLVLFSASLFAQPQIEVSEKIYDFGNIRQGDVVSHDYVIWNGGTEELKIERVRASCGCTAAHPEKDVLAPGDSTTLSVAFDSKGRKGVQKKYVYIFSNDPKQKQVRLAFTTKILEPGELDAKKVEAPKIALSKKEIDFGRVVAGDIKTAELNVVNKGKSDLVIKDIKSSCDCATTMMSSKKLSPGEVAFLSITFNSAGRNGELTRTVTLYTNDPKHSEETILLYANVVEGEDS